MFIIKGLDILEKIKNTHNIMELKQIKNALYDEKEISCLSNRKVHEALTLVTEKIKNVDKEELLHHLIDLLT